MKLRPGIGRNFHQFINGDIIIRISIGEKFSAELKRILLQLAANHIYNHGLRSFTVRSVHSLKMIIKEQNKHIFHSLHLFRIIGKVHASFRGAVIVEDCIAQLVKICIGIISRFCSPAGKHPIGADFVRDNHNFFAVVVHLACECLCNLYHLATAFLFSLGTISLYHIGIKCQEAILGV